MTDDDSLAKELKSMRHWETEQLNMEREMLINYHGMEECQK